MPKPSIHTYTLTIIGDSGELYSKRIPKYDANGQPLTYAKLVSAGERIAKDIIGYSGNVKVRVR